MRVIPVVAMLAGATVCCGSELHAQDKPAASVYEAMALLNSQMATIAVSCKMRPASWGQAFHAKVVEMMSTHAGNPLVNPHPPSDEERAVALARLEATEKGVRMDDPGQICDAFRDMDLTTVDDVVNGKTELWPAK